MSCVDLTDAVIRNCSGDGVNLDNAYLIRTEIEYSNFRSVVMAKTDVGGASFSFVNMYGSTIHDVDFSKVQRMEMIYLGNTSLLRTTFSFENSKGIYV